MILWRILSLFNLFWIVFAIVFVERTLQDNNIKAVLFKHTSNLLTPSHLLPMIIGIFSFSRSVYYAYENFRAGNGQIRPSLGLDTSIHPSVPTLQRTSIGRTMTWWLRLLSQSLHDSHSDAGEMKKNDDVQAVHDEWPTWQKILTAWLPWISVLSFWPWDKSERAKRIEGLNGEQQGKEAPESMTTGRHGAEP
ncbi:hypothetical protein GJ744_011157 [Endocarpon pusillum]|uniref:Uncharacterized protein n=1 Tax=Endocarpon pusillum TaxID=364733 RepID=A0A8H7AH09_9EURO|nr:hypothetical protein GJ744_011157 [Endocarpon pusillum]